MFSLIITIISIALVVALVAATMYYGGSALNQGTVKADASGFVASAQQIAVALAMNQVEGHGSNTTLVKSDSISADLGLNPRGQVVGQFEIRENYGLVSTAFSANLVTKNYLATIPVVKSGTLNPLGDASTVDTTWVLALDIPSGEDMQSEDLVATVASAEVCSKIRESGDQAGSDQGTYTCDIDSNLFRFHLTRRRSY